MRVLKPGVSIEAFLARLEAASSRALLLDYDGTLAPFQVDRLSARPYPEVIAPLEALTREPSLRVVAISGRLASEVRQLMGLERPPEIWGSHGWERIHPSGEHERCRPAAAASEALDAARTWVEGRGWAERFEEKVATVAFHWRGLEKAAARSLEEEVLAAWTPLSEQGGLELKSFDGGLELRVPGQDKGDAVRSVLDEMGPGTVAAFLGDDLTDEDAFRALGTSGLSVLVRGELRPTEADVWLEPPTELVRFLEGVLRCCRSGETGP